MTDGLPPLPPEAQRLFDAERGHRPPPAGARDVVLARVLRTVGAPTGPGGATSHVGGALPWLARVAAVAAAVAAVAVGARSLRRPDMPTPVVAHAAAPERVGPSPTSPAAVTETSAPSMAPVDTVTAPSSHLTNDLGADASTAGRSARTEHRADDDLVAQVTLVDAARAALDRRDPDEALRVVRRYRRMPARRLDDEIDVCEVRALVARGDRESAERAVARFHRAHPRSVLGAVVDEAWRAMR